jgi:heme exporter protein D
MLIISLVLAVIGLAALVFAVITSNELVAWVCIGASVLGVVLLIIDALQERRRREAGLTADHSGSAQHPDAHDDEEAAEYPADAVDEVDGSPAHPDSEHAVDSGGDDHTHH